MNKIKRCPVALVGACSVIIALLTVQARGQGLGKESGPYLNFAAGVNMMSAEFKADPGFRLSAAAGYNFNKWAGLELETGLLYNTRTSEVMHRSSYLGQVPIVANFVLRYENESKFVPYVGIGAGGDVIFGQRRESSSTATTFDFVYQPMAGVRYKLNERTSVGVGYKYLGYVSTVTFLGTQLGNHSVLLDLNWKF